MVEASRRAHNPPRVGRPECRVVAAAVEAVLPSCTRSLIRSPSSSVVRCCGPLSRSIPPARPASPADRSGGAVEILLAPAARDRLEPALDIRRRLVDGLAADWGTFGLDLRDTRPATACWHLRANRLRSRSHGSVILTRPASMPWITG
jgi:hypothetical protein